MRPIEIKRDRTLSGAYFFFAAMLAITGIYYYFISWEKTAGYSLFLTAGAVAALAAFLSDPRPLLTINQNGIKPKYKPEVNWPEIHRIVFERRSFENKFYSDVEFLDEKQEKLFSMSLNRTNMGAKELAEKIEKILVEAHQEHIHIIPESPKK